MSITAFFSSIFSDAAAKVTDSVTKGLDGLFTSDEERITAEGKIKIAVGQQLAALEARTMEHVENREKELTERLALDMKSDSWLSKNVRPMTLLGLTGFLMALSAATVFAKISAEFQPVLEMWVNLFTVLDVTAFGFYFGSRGLEKVVDKLSGKFGNGKN